jgi:ATP/maltotriose-dependent transcriptional regulator MalT
VLLGRSAELGLVEQLVEEVRAGSGRTLLVTGPPGIGKTALLEQAVGQAGPGMRVLRVAGVEEEAEMPYSALHPLLRPVLDRIDELPEPQAAALRGAFGMAPPDAVDPLPAGFAALTLLSGLAVERPLLCLVDDGHCVDTATVEAVRFVARRIADEPIGILFATREDDGRARSLPRLHLKGLGVVRLAATGATNRDIGAELFLSPRTVAQHLYRAFPKLGVATRMELASLDLDAD